MAEKNDEMSLHQSQSELLVKLGARVDLSDNMTLLLAVGHDVHNSLTSPSSVMTYLVCK